MYAPVNPSFNIHVQVGCKGTFITRNCFRDVSFYRGIRPHTSLIAYELQALQITHYEDIFGTL